MTSVEMVAPEMYNPVRPAVAGSCAEANRSGAWSLVAARKRPLIDRRSLAPSSHSALLDQAYEEFYRCLENGEQPDIQEYCARFPSCRSELRRTLEFDGFLGDNPTYLEDDVPWPTVGEQCGDLTLLRPLGRGRFARVFLAAEASTGGRLVVVKFSVRGDAEARTLGRLSHPHIVPILSARVEESTGLTMACMPYLGSATLEHVLQRVPPPSEAPRSRNATDLFDAIRALRSAGGSACRGCPSTPAHGQLHRWRDPSGRATGRNPRFSSREARLPSRFEAVQCAPRPLRQTLAAGFQPVCQRVGDRRSQRRNPRLHGPRADSRFLERAKGWRG